MSLLMKTRKGVCIGDRCSTAKRFAPSKRCAPGAAGGLRKSFLAASAKSEKALGKAGVLFSTYSSTWVRSCNECELGV